MAPRVKREVILSGGGWQSVRQTYRMTCFKMQFQSDVGLTSYLYLPLFSVNI
jgi:hypothetical protein